MTKKMMRCFAGENTPIPPVWLMRQAGRYLPEYLTIRAEAGSFLDLVYNPRLATEVTLQPIRRYGLDAAILFSDILVVPHALGQEVAFEAHHGPVLGSLPDFNSFDITKFQQFLVPVYDTVSSIKEGLHKECFDDTALIGFSGAPWTLASYMIEGKGSKDFQKARLMGLMEPERFSNMMGVLVQAVSAYLLQQIVRGAEIIQLFDSWAGVLSTQQIREWVIAPTRRIVENIRAIHPQVPIIGFPKGIGAMLPEYVRDTGVSGVSLDSATPLEWAISVIPSHVVIQGNLDPLLLIRGGSPVKDAVCSILQAVVERPHIFNLGHGIDKETPPEHVAELIRTVRRV